MHAYPFNTHTLACIRYTLYPYMFWLLNAAAAATLICFQDTASGYSSYLKVERVLVTTYTQLWLYANGGCFVILGIYYY